MKNNYKIPTIDKKELIGADWLVYQDLDDLVRCSSEGNPSIASFECSVFNGEYVTGDVDQKYLDWLDESRNDKAQELLRNKKNASNFVNLQDEL